MVFSFALIIVLQFLLVCLVECLDSSFIYDEVGILPAFSSWIERADAPASSSFCFNPF